MREVAIISSAANPMAPFKAGAKGWKRGIILYRRWKAGKSELAKAASLIRIIRAMQLFDISNQSSENVNMARQIVDAAMEHDDPEEWIDVFAAAVDDLQDIQKAIPAANAVFEGRE